MTKKKKQDWEKVHIPDPFDGPMSENAYPEDRKFKVGDRWVSMNQIARNYNKAHGYEDEAADEEWTEEAAASPVEEDGGERDPASEGRQTEDGVITADKLGYMTPENPQPFWAVAHVIYDRGPVVAVLWWDDDSPRGYEVDDEGNFLRQADPTAPNWSYWVIADRAPGPAGTDSTEPLVGTAEEAGTPNEALRVVFDDLVGREVPTMT